jgi:hypothetical protein
VHGTHHHLFLVFLPAKGISAAKNKKGKKNNRRAGSYSKKKGQIFLF